jgi:hypothetical protein
MDDYESLSHSKWECKSASRIEEDHLLPDHVHMLISCDPLGSCIRREEAELCRPALLGEGILRIHSRTRHRGDT